MDIYANGQLISGIPDDASPEDIAKIIDAVSSPSQSSGTGGGDTSVTPPPAPEEVKRDENGNRIVGMQYGAVPIVDKQDNVAPVAYPQATSRDEQGNAIVGTQYGATPVVDRQDTVPPVAPVIPPVADATDPDAYYWNKLNELTQQNAGARAPGFNLAKDYHDEMRGKMDRHDVIYDPEYMKRAETVFQIYEGISWDDYAEKNGFKPTPEGLADYVQARAAEFQDQFTGFDGNGAVGVAIWARNAEDYQRDALRYILQAQENIKGDWMRTGQMVYNTLGDPLTVATLAPTLLSLGTTRAAPAAAQALAKSRAMELLSTAAHYGSNAFAIGASKNAIDQAAMNNLEGKDTLNIDVGKVATAGLITGVTAGGIGVGIHLLASNRPLRARAPEKFYTTGVVTNGALQDSHVLILHESKDGAGYVVQTGEGKTAFVRKTDIQTQTSPGVPVANSPSKGRAVWKKAGGDVEVEVVPRGTKQAVHGETYQTVMTRDGKKYLAPQSELHPDTNPANSGPIRAPNHEIAEDYAMSEAANGNTHVTKKGLMAQGLTEAEATAALKRMEHDGVVGPADPMKGRPILMTPADLANLRSGRVVPPNAPVTGPATIQDFFDAVKWAASQPYEGYTGLSEVVMHIKSVLDRMGHADIGTLSKQLTVDALGHEERGVIVKSVQDLNDRVSLDLMDAIRERNNALDQASYDIANNHVKALEDLQRVTSDLDEHLGGGSAFDLGSRAGGVMTGDLFGSSIDDILKKKFGYTDPALATEADRLAAQEVFANDISASRAAGAQTDEVIKLRREADSAANNGDMDTFFQKMEEADAISEYNAEQNLLNMGYTKRTVRAIRRLVHNIIQFKVNMILGVSSLVGNAISYVKIPIQPLFHGMRLGIITDEARYYTATAYSTMAHSIKNSLYNGAQRFRYEFDINGFDKFLERNASDLSGRFMRYTRIIPRLMASADVSASTIVYRSSVAAMHAVESLRRGKDLGLSGNNLDIFVKQEVEKALDKSYQPLKDGTVAQLLYRRGVELGYRGPALQNWVIREMTNNRAFFRRAINEVGLEYTGDVLMNRAASGRGGAYSGTISKAVRSFQQFMNSNNFLGQFLKFNNPFIVYPVRLVEWALRTTPGYNMLMPHFVADLMGKRGPMKQGMAQGQLMLANALFGIGVLAYASGNYTNQGATDVGRQKLFKEMRVTKPFSFNIFGHRIVTTNMDFLSNMSVMGSFFDRLGEYWYRRQQGEYTSNNVAQAIAAAQLTYMPVVELISHTPSLAGFARFSNIFRNATSDSPNSKAADAASEMAAGWITDFFKNGTKIAELLSETHDQVNPAGVQQRLLAAIDPSGDKFVISKRLDAFGHVMKYDNPAAAITGIDAHTDEERMKASGLTKEQIANQNAWFRICQSSGSAELPRYKAEQYFGDVDLRTMKTADGKDTWYNRIGQYMSESGLDDEFYANVTVRIQNKAGILGTRKIDGQLVTDANKIMNKYRNEAIERFINEELSATDQYLSVMTRKDKTQDGVYDNWNVGPSVPPIQ